MDHFTRLTVAAQLTALDALDALDAVRRRIASDRNGDERGEGVISAAIAVLIMASIGAAMFAAYKGLFDRTSSSVSAKVDQISQ